MTQCECIYFIKYITSFDANNKAHADTSQYLIRSVIRVESHLVNLAPLHGTNAVKNPILELTETHF